MACKARGCNSDLEGEKAVKENWWKWLIAAIAIGILITLCNDKNIERKNRNQTQHANRQAEDTDAKQRFEKWAYIAKEKQISTSETVRLLIIPEPMGMDLFDTKCLIYSNAEYKTAQMICPDADKDMIKEKNDD